MPRAVTARAKEPVMRGPFVSTLLAALLVLPGCTGPAGNGTDSPGPMGTVTSGGAGSVPAPGMNGAGSAGRGSSIPAAGDGGAVPPPASTAPVATPAIA